MPGRVTVMTPSSTLTFREAALVPISSMCQRYHVAVTPPRSFPQLRTFREQRKGSHLPAWRSPQLSVRVLRPDVSSQAK